jgi:hypothetical protein
MTDTTEASDDPPVVSAVDEPQRKRRESVKKRKEREDREFLKMALNVEAGRRFLWNILAECHTFETIFRHDHGLPIDMATWMCLGEQQIGQRLYQLWHIKNPVGVMAMLKENDPRFAEVVL